VRSGWADPGKLRPVKLGFFAPCKLQVERRRPRLKPSGLLTPLNPQVRILLP
jgi:hypothetical protein